MLTEAHSGQIRSKLGLGLEQALIIELPLLSVRCKRMSLCGEKPHSIAGLQASLRRIGIVSCW